MQKGKCHVHFFVKKMSRVVLRYVNFVPKVPPKVTYFLFLGKVCMVLTHPIWCTFGFLSAFREFLFSRKSVDATNTPKKNLLIRENDFTPVKRKKTKYFSTFTLLRKVSLYKKAVYPRKTW